MRDRPIYDASHLVAAEDVPTYYGLELFEHYQEDGHLLVATSDASAIRLEPGDYIVKRLWSTGVVPYIYNRAATP
jgi:hypothetical protein